MVSLSATIMSSAKTAEPSKMLFVLWTWVGPDNRVLDGVQIPSSERAILRGKGLTIVKCSDYRPCAAAVL